jgi:hypothetical protein
MGGARFRYALEPVALQRRWALDALLRDLGACNAELARRRGECDAVLGELALAGREWKALGGDGRTVQVDRFALLARYMADRRRQAQEMEQFIAALQQQREMLIAQVAQGQRAVDAVDEHRGQMRKQFIRDRLSGDFKLADDQWSVMQTARISDGD